VANGKLLRSGVVDNLWVQPAAGDAGGALGAAFVASHIHGAVPRTVSPENKDSMRGSYLGPNYPQQDIENRLSQAGAKFTVLSDAALFDTVSDALQHEQAVGWFQGRMEFGPRALGGRSILGDSRSSTMQSVLNLKVKYRESFRPFAPSVLADSVDKYFDIDRLSPYMLLVADVVKDRQIPLTDEQQALFGIEKLNVPRSDIPAVTHVDYSARIQTVHEDTNPRYHALLNAFEQKTGCALLVNTSFNVRGEPIVNTPEDAFRCFMGTEMDGLAIGNCWLEKAAQDASLKANYEDKFELD
jgi:carbamoyltransferase